MGAKSKYPEDYSENGISYRYCSICEEFHDIDRFYATNNRILRMCKEQYAIKNRASVQKHRGLEETHNKDIKSEAERVLTVLGFELHNDDNPIHEQFNRRIERKYGGLR